MTSVPVVRLARLALRATFVLLVAGSASAEAPAESPTPTLEALMAGMAETTGVWARFVEHKEIALLSEPIETRGRWSSCRRTAARRSTASRRARSS